MFKYSKLIKCLICGKNFRGKTERNNKKVYICSGYNNYGNNFCPRNKIDEEELDFIINQHIKIYDGTLRGETKKEIKVNEITISLDEIVIYYDDGLQSIKNSYRVHF